MLADPLFETRRIGERKVAGHRILLARALRNLGQYEEALPLAESAAAMTERILGPDDYATLIQWSTVASIHDYAGDCTKALPIARMVRARMAKRYGEHRQGTLVETGNLGFKEYDCGDRGAGWTTCDRPNTACASTSGKTTLPRTVSATRWQRRLPMTTSTTKRCACSKASTSRR